MKILRPVPVSKRLPSIAKKRIPVLLRNINNPCEEKMDYAFFFDNNRRVLLFDSEVVYLDKLQNEQWELIEWFEEIEVESLFPDKETAYRVASQASNSMNGISLHSEGQDFARNYFLKKLQQ